MMTTHEILQEYIDINHPGYKLIELTQTSTTHINCITKNNEGWFNFNISFLDLLTFVYNKSKIQ